MPHEYPADPSSVSVQTIVQRIIENVAHASKKVDEFEGYAETGLGHQLLSSIGIRLENIGLLAEELIRRLDSAPYSGEKNADENDDDFGRQHNVLLLDADHASIEKLLVGINTALSSICKDSDYAVDAQEFLDRLSQRLFRKNICDLTNSNMEWVKKILDVEEDYIR